MVSLTPVDPILISTQGRVAGDWLAALEAWGHGCVRHLLYINEFTRHLARMVPGLMGSGTCVMSQ